MNTLFNIVHIIIFILLAALILDMMVYTILCTVKRTSMDRMNDFKKNITSGAVMFGILNLGYFLLGMVLIRKGELIMTASELVLKIASKMHMASMAFVVAALIVTAVTVFCAAAEEGNIGELKKLLGNCITSAIVFWILAWLIV